jgi:hypothetical protein
MNHPSSNDSPGILASGAAIRAECVKSLAGCSRNGCLHCRPTALIAPTSTTEEIHLFRRQLFAAALVCAVAIAPVHAQTTDVSGVKFNHKVTVAATALQLNGAGTRYKAIFKVYSAALYLPNKATTPEAVLATPGAKRMHVVMLREIDANELGKLFTRGMQDNSSREEFGKSIAGTLRLSEMFAAKKRLVAGEQFTVDFVPGTGTIIAVNGQVQGEPIKEPEFFSALMRIWLGRSPADSLLKNALLGQSPERAPHES